MARLRHETDHAAQRAQERRISPEERKKVLRKPDQVKHDGNLRLHYDNTSRQFVSICAVIALGTGTMVLANNPIFGVGIGGFATVITYYLTKKPKCNHEEDH